MATDLSALMALRVQGVSPPERLACALGATVNEASERARSLAAAELAMERTLGRTSGYALTPDGAAALECALDREGLRGDAELLDVYERFCVLNERFLKVASDWQVRGHGKIEATNDHQDADYDQSVIDRLCELHDRAAALVARMVGRSPRLESYRGRLDDCVRRLCDGDRSAFTAALAESYHTVWFELHQDLILTLGVERQA